MPGGSCSTDELPSPGSSSNYNHTLGSEELDEKVSCLYDFSDGIFYKCLICANQFQRKFAVHRHIIMNHLKVWGKHLLNLVLSGKLPFECQKFAKNLIFFLIAKNVHLKKKIATFKWQFSRGSSFNIAQVDVRHGAQLASLSSDTLIHLSNILENSIKNDRSTQTIEPRYLTKVMLLF